MQKIKKAFTLVELMVVIAVIAVLATVSVVGYKSYVRRENINASVTEARQIREVVISQIVADSDGKITLNIRNEAGEIYNTIDFTYENGVLQVSSEDPNAKSDTLAEIEDFDRAMRNTFPSLASLPGTLAYSGNDLFYHHLNIESIIEVLENGTITEDNLLDPGYPYEKNDVAVNIYTLTYITYIEEGRGDDGYDQIQFSISATSVYLECVEEGSASTSNIIELTYFINPRDTEISFGVIDNVYSKSDQENIATITIGEPDASGYGKIKIVAHNPTLKGEMLIGFTAKNVGRTLSIKVLEKGRLTIGAPKQITKFEYKPSADNFKVGLEQKVTPEDFGISSEKLVKTGIVEMTYDSAKTTLQQPGDTIRVKFSIKNKDYCWADDFSTDPKYITVTLDKFMLPTPTLNKKELVYNGKDQEPDSIKDDWSIGDFDTYVEIVETGNILSSVGELLEGAGKYPGTYFTTFEIKDTNDYLTYFAWKANPNSRSITVEWKILKKTILVPTITLENPDTEDGLGYRYDGTEKSVKITYASGTEQYIQVGGVAKATDAGAYKVILSIWNDNDHKEVTARDLLFNIPLNSYPYGELYEFIDAKGKRISTQVEFDWHIDGVEIPIPTVGEHVFEYDGKPHKPELIWPEGYERYNNMVTVSSATGVGDYDISVAINVSTDGGRNAKFEGGLISITVPMTITPATLTTADYPPAVSGIEKTYTGLEQTVELKDFGSSYDSKKIQLSGETSGIGANTYTVKIKPTSNYRFADGSEEKTSTWKIVKAKVSKPTPKSNLHMTYTGSGLSPFTTTLDSKIDVTGDVPPQTNYKEGGYTTTLSLDKDSCEWTSGGYDSYSVTWYIDKANSSVTKAPTATNPKGINQALVNAGTASGGTLYYALGSNNTTEPTSGWETTIPKGSKIGTTYYVWYYVKGDSNHNDTTPKCVSSSVAKADNTITIKENQNKWATNYTAGNQTRTLDAATNANGAVTYAVTSQKDSNGRNVSYFSFSSSSQAILKMAGGTPVGTYNVNIRATAAGDDNHESGYADTTITVQVTKTTASITTAPTAKTGLTYTGNPQELINAGVASVGEIEYAVTTSSSTSTWGLNWSSSIPTKTDTGTYYVWYRISSTDSLDGVSATRISQAITISKIKASITTAPTAKTGLTYTGSAQELVNAGVASVGTIEYAVTTSSGTSTWNLSWSSNIPTKTDAGTYYVWYRISDSDGYDGVSATKISQAITISKVKASITTAPTAKTGLTYTGSAQALVNAGVASVGEIEYAVTTSSNNSAPSSGWSTSIPTKTDAGTYYVWYRISSTDSLDGVSAAKISQAITIAKVTNSITASNQSITINYSKNSKTTVNFNDATSTYGSVSYSIKSQKNSKNQSVTSFSFESASIISSTKVLKAAKKTAAGTYTVVITATVDGTDNYDKVTKDFTLTITVKN